MVGVGLNTSQPVDGQPGKDIDRVSAGQTNLLVTGPGQINYGTGQPTTQKVSAVQEKAGLHDRSAAAPIELVEKPTGFNATNVNVEGQFDVADGATSTGVKAEIKQDKNFQRFAAAQPNFGPMLGREQSGEAALVKDSQVWAGGVERVETRVDDRVWTVVNRAHTPPSTAKTQGNTNHTIASSSAVERCDDLKKIRCSNTFETLNNEQEDDVGISQQEEVSASSKNRQEQQHSRTAGARLQEQGTGKSLELVDFQEVSKARLNTPQGSVKMQQQSKLATEEDLQQLDYEARSLAEKTYCTVAEKDQNVTNGIHSRLATVTIDDKTGHGSKVPDVLVNEQNNSMMEQGKDVQQLTADSMSISGKNSTPDMQNSSIRRSMQRQIPPVQLVPVSSSNIIDEIPGHGVQKSGKTCETPLKAGAQFYAPAQTPSAVPFHYSAVQRQYSYPLTNGRTSDYVDVMEVEYATSRGGRTWGIEKEAHGELRTNNSSNRTMEAGAQTACLKAGTVSLKEHGYASTSSNEDSLRRSTTGVGWTVVEALQNTHSTVKKQQQQLSAQVFRQNTSQIITSSNGFEVLQDKKEGITVCQTISSNTPKIHFSSPHVEKIIKDTQVSMMLNANPMTKQPLVTLNTLALEIPSQSLESFGEHGIESRQLLLSTGNDYDVVKEDMREQSNTQIGLHDNAQDQREHLNRVMLQRKLWADQVEDEEDDDELDSACAQGLQSSGKNNNSNIQSQASIVKSDRKEGGIIRHSQCEFQSKRGMPLPHPHGPIDLKKI